MTSKSLCGLNSSPRDVNSAVTAAIIVTHLGGTEAIIQLRGLYWYEGSW